MEVLVVVEPERVDDPERRLRAVDLGDGNGAVELDNRRAGEAEQLAVEGGDLCPVDRMVGLH